MATHTLTSSSPEQIFALASDGTVQVILSDDSVFTSGSRFILEYETETPSVYIPVPQTRTSEPYSRIYTLKAGNIKVKVEGTLDQNTSVVVDIKE